jgi:hypothetical protein
MPDAPYALVGNGGPRGLPRVTLDPPSVATRKHGDLVAPAPGQARGRLQARTGGSRGGHLREPPALVDRLPDRALVQREPLRQIGPPGSRLVRRSSAPAADPAPAAAHQVIESLARGSPVGIAQHLGRSTLGSGSWILDRLALPRPFASEQLPYGPPTCSTSGRSPPTRHRAPTSWPPDCPACGADAPGGAAATTPRWPPTSTWTRPGRGPGRPDNRAGQLLVPWWVVAC